MSHVTVVKSGSERWLGFYIDGRLISQGINAPVREVLQLMLEPDNDDFAGFRVRDEWLDAQEDGRFPYYLNDIPQEERIT